MKVLFLIFMVSVGLFFILGALSIDFRDALKIMFGCAFIIVGIHYYISETIEDINKKHKR